MEEFTLQASKTDRRYTKCEISKNQLFQLLRKEIIVKKKIVLCFTFSLSLYNDLKVLKTGGQPLLKFILRNLSKHSLNFSP